MPKLPTILAAFLAAAAITGPAFAAQGSPPAATRAALSAKIQIKFKSLDTNGNGSIDKSEIDAVNTKAAERTDATIEKKLQDEFSRLDINKDKAISFAEFRAVAPQVKGVPADVLITRMDGDKDGKISLKEYTAATLLAFDRIDANKDGVVSEAEQQAIGSR